MKNGEGLSASPFFTQKIEKREYLGVKFFSLRMTGRVKSIRL